MEKYESLSVGERIKRALNRRIAQAREEQEHILDESILAETLERKTALEKELDERKSHLGQLRSSRDGELTKFKALEMQWRQAEERYSRGIPLLEAEVAKLDGELAEVKKLLPEDVPILQADPVVEPRTNEETPPQPTPHADKPAPLIRSTLTPQQLVDANRRHDDEPKPWDPRR